MEKKNYSSPKLQVEQFSTSHTFADGCTGHVTEESVWLPCTVECIISSEDTIFATQTGSGGNWGNTPCEHKVNPGGQSAGEYYFVTYPANNRLYFVWHSQAAGGAGGYADFNTLTAILSEAGLRENVDYNSNGMYLVNGRRMGGAWHAGPADGPCEEQFKKLYSFSY